MGRHEPVVDWATDFDHTDDAYVADPFAIWDELRSTCPVAHTERYNGAWLPTRHEDIAAIGSGPFKVEVDLMQPIDPNKAPKVHDPQLNHIGLWIDHLAAAVEWLTAKGMRFTPGGIRKGAAGYDVCFVHPKGNDAAPLSGEGVLIELIQAPPEVIEAFAKVQA